MTTRIKASELHLHVGDILAQIRHTGERVIIERRGQPIAALVPMQDLEQLQQDQAPLSFSFHLMHSVYR